MLGLFNLRRAGRRTAWRMACISLFGVAVHPVGLEAAETEPARLAGERILSIAFGSSDGAFQADGALQRADCWDAAPSDARVRCHSERDEGTSQIFYIIHQTNGEESPTDAKLVTGFSVFDITATAGLDYTPSSAGGRLTIEIGESRTASVELTTHDDELDEHTERFGIHAWEISGPAPLSFDYVVKAIADTDDPPSMSITDVEGPESAGSFAFAVELDAPSGKQITVRFATSDATATAGPDYGTTRGTLTFAAGETTATVEVPVVNDGIAESDETFEVTLSMPVNVTIADGSATGTIEDTGTLSKLTVTSPPQAVEDVVGDLGFVLTLDPASAVVSTVEYATRGGTAAADADYTSTSGTLSFAAGATSGTIEVAVTADTVPEETETFTLSLSNATDAVVVGSGIGTGTILDDDMLLSTEDVGVDESEGTMEFVLTAAYGGGRTADATVDYQTAAATATEGADYGRAEGTLTFAPGVASRTIVVTVEEDDLDEVDETLTLAFSNVRNAVLREGEAVGTIRDDDDPPEFGIGPATAAEGDGELVFTARLTGPSGRRVGRDYETSELFGEGAAREEDDFDYAGGRIVFDPGETEFEVRVRVHDDALDEPDEKLEMRVYEDGDSLGTRALVAVGTIEDDDDPPRLAVSDERAPEDAGGMDFEVTLDAPSGRDVVVDHVTSDGTASAGSDYEEAVGTLTFRAGELAQPVPVQINDDDLSEADETFVLELEDPEYATIADGQGTGTIEDDDEAAAELSVRDATGTEGGTADFAVSLSDASGRPVTVGYEAVDGTAVEGDDYAATRGTLTFAPGTTAATIPVALEDDALNERTETFRLVLESPTNALIAKGRATGTVRDDDAEPGVSVGDADGAEDVERLEFAVTLDPASGREVTVSYGTVDGTAVAESDYTGVLGILTFAPGETGKTVEVRVLDDDRHESDETFGLVLSDPDGATPGTARGTGSIRDDDEPAPTMDVADAAGVEGGTADFVVDLDKPSGQTVTVAYATADGTAAADGDYVAADGVLTLAPGRLSGTIEVTLVDDAVDEPNETFTLTLSAAGHATLRAAVATGTVGDNDDPPRLSVADVVGTEGGTAELTVVLAGSGSAAATVAYATSDGTAVAGADYGSAAGELTFAPGATAATVSVTLVDDAVNEPNETFGFTLSGPANATLGRSAAQVTVIDDDGAPQLSVTGGSGVEGASVTFAVTVSGAGSQAVTVAYATSDATASAGEDYEATQGMLTFAVGDSARTVTVALLDDAMFEPTETFALTLSSAVNAMIAAGTAEGRIVDDDDRPTLAIADAAGVEGSGPMEFEVTLSGTGSEPVTVIYGTVDGTATAVGDYEASDGVLSFAPGESARTLRVTLLDDAEHEPEETFAVTLSSAENAVVDVGRAQGRIADDDAAPTLAVVPATGAEGGVARFVVALTGATGRTVTVAYATVDGTARAGEDYGRSRGRLTYAPGETRGTVEVALVQDALDEPDETFALTLSSAVNAVVAGARGDGTIIDDDAQPGLSVTGGADIEGGEVVFGVVLAAPSGRTVVVGYATSDGTASAGRDYEAASGTLTFPPGATAGEIRVGLLDDDLDEPEETFALTLSSPVNASLTGGSADGRIVDNDGAASLTIGDAAVDEGGVLEFAVRLAGSSERTATVRWATMDGTAASAEDYEAGQGILTFAPGVATAVVGVATVQDDVVEADETFEVVLSSAENATVADARGTGTIVNDDRHREISVADAAATEGEALDFVATLDAPLSLPVTVDYATADGTAGAGEDYTPARGTLTFAAGETRATVSVALVDDDVPETREEFYLLLSAPTNAVVAAGTATGTIIDDDRLPVLSVADASAAEGAGELTFAVALDAATGSTATVAYATADGTATRGADYEAGSGILTFAPGELERAVRVRVIDDTVDEADETFTLTLTDPRGATLGDGAATAVATGTIEDDDDEPPVVSIADGAAAEGDGELALAVVLDRAAATAVTAAYTTADATAAAGEDYEARSGTLTFAPGETERILRVAVLDDAVHEADEAFAVRLAAPEGASIGDGDGMATIRDDDAPPTLSIADASGAEDAGELAFAVVLDAASGIGATVAYATADGTATAGGDYASTAGTLSFAPGETEQVVRVAVLDDAVVEPDEETFTVVLSGPGGATLADGEATAVATGTILDDDLAPPLATGELPRAMLCVGGAEFELDLADHFDGVELGFSAVSSAPGVATASLAGSRLTLAPVAVGETAVTVTATNPAGSASATLAVRVVTDPAELAAVEAVLSSLGRGVLASVAGAVGERFAVRGAAAAGPSPGAEGARAAPGPWSPVARNPADPGGHGFGRDAPAGLSGERASAELPGMEHGPPPFATRRAPFAFALGASAGDPGPAWTVWGRGDTQRFEAGLEGTSHRGSLTGVQVGADVGTDDWLAGVSVMRTEVDADYRFERSVDACGGGTGEGLLRADLTGIHPYAGRAVGRGWVWLALGAGEGEVVVERCGSGRLVAADLSTRLAVLGGRHPFAGGERLALSVVEEVGVLGLSTGNAGPPLGDRSVTVGRARLGLELAGVAPADCDCSLTTFVRALARGDWGDGATGTGLELAAGVRYRNQPRRLGVDLGIRTLVLYSADDVEDHAANLALWLLPKAAGTGWHGTLSLRRDPRRPGLDLAGGAPWAGHAGRLPPGADGRWLAGMRLGYGIARRRGTATPYLELDAGRAAGGGRLGVRHEFDRLFVEWGIERSADDRRRSGNGFVLTVEGQF